MRHTLRVIRDEHAVLSAVLRSIGLLLSETRRHKAAPDFTGTLVNDGWTTR